MAEINLVQRLFEVTVIEYCVMHTKQKRKKSDLEA